MRDGAATAAASAHAEQGAAARTKRCDHGGPLSLMAALERRSRIASRSRIALLVHCRAARGEADWPASAGSRPSSSTFRPLARASRRSW